MTFENALRSADGASFVYRTYGPVFHIDLLGEIRLVMNSVYLGDILEMDDWHVSKRL